MRLAAMAPTIVGMETSAGFGKSDLLLTDARLALGVLNHLRYQALNRAFGASREQANVLTAVLLLGAADGAYESMRRIAGLRLHVSGADAALGAIALRDASLSIAGPNVRAIPGFGTLVAFAIVAGFAVPALRQTARRVRAAEQRLRGFEARVRSQRISRYAAERNRVRASAA
jgi:hypothetical protein